MQTEIETQENATQIEGNSISQSIKLAKRLHRNLGSINQMAGIDKEASTTEKCLNALKKALTLRTIEDISVLKLHLMKSDLNNKFKLDKVSNENYDKLLVIMATYANYEYIPLEKYIYKIGDKALFLYIIIQGSVHLYTSNAIVKYLSAYEYYTKLLLMKESQDRDILLSTIKENMSIYPIEVNDIEIIELIILKLIVNDIPNKNVKEDLEKAFPLTKINPSKLGIDFENQGIFKINDIINDKVKHISNEKIFQYRFIMNNSKRNYIKIFDYELFDKYSSGGVFGEEVYSKYIHSVLVQPGTHLCKIDSLLYGEQLKVERNKTLNKEITFILNNFFLSSIPRKRFERDYFKYFLKAAYKKGDVIYNENELINNLYFIQTGEIELSSNRTVLEMHGLVNRLTYLSIDEANNNMCFDFNIKNSPNDLFNNIVKKIKTRLFIVINQELLGVESWFKMPFLFTATVRSESVELYKIPLCHLKELLNDCDGIKEEFDSTVKKKINIIAKRLNSVNSTTLSLIDQYHEVKEENQVIHYNERLIKDNKTVVNVKKIEEYKGFENKKLTNTLTQVFYPNSKHLKEHKDIKISLQKHQLNANPSVESMIEKKRTIILPKIQKTIISDSSFENRLFLKLKKEIQSINSSSISMSLNINNVNASSSINCITKPEISAFMTEITQVDKRQLTERKCSKRNNRGNTQEANTLTFPQKHKIYRSPITIERLKKYAIFDQNNSLSNRSKQDEKIYYQYKTIDNSVSPSSNLMKVYQRNKLFNQVIETRRIEHLKYKNTMINKINLMIHPLIK